MKRRHRALGLQLGVTTHWSVLLLQLTPSLPLLSLNTFLLTSLQHLFVFHTQLATLHVEAIERRHDGVGIC